VTSLAKNLNAQLLSIRLSFQWKKKEKQFKKIKTEASSSFFRKNNYLKLVVIEKAKHLKCNPYQGIDIIWNCSFEFN